MLVLGLDPSTTSTGYGLVEGDGRRQVAYIDCGCFRPPRKASLDQRLRVIFDGVNEVLQERNPDAVAIEGSFFGKDADAAAKKALTGNGQATKESVQYMVAKTLKMKKLPSPLDASDALAIALCHLHRPAQDVPGGRGRKPEIEALLRRVSSR